jgi:hypothetical protein
MVREKPLPAIQVLGPWDRLHRAESDVLAGLLTAAERDAVNRRLGLASVLSPAWVPPSSGPEGGRFVGPRGPGALYLGNNLETCIQEIAYHHAGHCKASTGTPPGTRAVLRHLVFQVDADFADATADRNGGLHKAGDYGPSWAFGRRVLTAELAGVHYRSVRSKGGHCLAVLKNQAITFLRVEFGAVVLEWDGFASHRIA